MLSKNIETGIYMPAGGAVAQQDIRTTKEQIEQEKWQKERRQRGKDKLPLLLCRDFLIRFDDKGSRVFLSIAKPENNIVIGAQLIDGIKIAVQPFPLKSSMPLHYAAFKIERIFHPVCLQNAHSLLAALS